MCCYRTRERGIGEEIFWERRKNVARKYRKNANAEGSVFQRKDGYWVAQYAVTCNAVTLDVYSHMIPGMGDRVVRAMEDALS